MAKILIFNKSGGTVSITTKDGKVHQILDRTEGGPFEEGELSDGIKHMLTTNLLLGSSFVEPEKKIKDTKNPAKEEK